LSDLSELALIAAMTRDRVIGKGNTIPWHHPEDMRHFRRLTTGHAILMGRATFESIGRPLPKRRNIVISRALALSIPGCEVVSSLDAAIELAHSDDDQPFVIGGEQIYRLALPLATRIHLTYVPEHVEGDRYFPELDSARWTEIERREESPLIFVTLASQSLHAPSR